MDLNFESLLFDSKKYPIEIDFYLNNDLNVNVKYSITGLTNYNVTSTYLGQLYNIPLNYNLNFDNIDKIIYKNNNIYLYNYDLSNINLASTIILQNNNFLELYINFYDYEYYLYTFNRKKFLCWNSYELLIIHYLKKRIKYETFSRYRRKSKNVRILNSTDLLIIFDLKAHKY